jgi:hypothetical protein
MANKSKKMSRTEYETREGEMKNVYRILVDKFEEWRPLAIPRRRQQNHIKICIKNIHLAQDRDRLRAVVNAAMKLRVLTPWS